MVVVDVHGETRRIDDAGLGSHAGSGSRSRRRRGSARRSPPAARAADRVARARGTGTRPGAARAHRGTSRRPCRARSNARPVASSEPRASPSGASCEVTTKRSLSRRAAATACMSAGFDIGVRRSELVDQLREPDAPLDRGIVFEREDRRPPRAELARDLRLQDAVRRLQPVERALPARPRCRAR